MRPSEFYQCTLNDIWLMIQAHRSNVSDAWERTRFQSYLIYCANTEKARRETIYQFLPLDGDPTEEEQQASEKKKRDARRKRFSDFAEEVKQYHKQRAELENKNGIRR